MSAILVTGGAGRLGRSVVSVLADAGHDVVSVDITTAADLPARQLVTDLLEPGVAEQVVGDVRPDHVVHLAAIAVPFSRPDCEIFRINTSLTYAVIDATVAAGARSLLVASSPTVLGYGAPNGWKPNYLPLDEAHPVAPWHGYAASKDAMERLVAMAARQHGPAVRFASFRPCYVIAPEEWEGAPTQQGHTVAERLADPDLSAPALFNYVDARDAGEFVQAWLVGYESVPNGTLFFVGAQDALATRPVGELLPRYLGDLGGGVDLPGGTMPMFDSGLAARLLGWTSKRSWRTELDPEARAAVERSAVDEATAEGVR